ncbi:gastric triacylglycerol lipase-like [Epargyreus clarus]|uniref:gastric triacylglycerol lipase-like n=1 Tax=Epargyreus clarus TaxID=520877 RepID=UPI003C2FA83D
MVPSVKQMSVQKMFCREKYGYKVEVHKVITSDGYILSLYRIPGKGKVIFLMHGLLSSYVDWLTFWDYSFDEIGRFDLPIMIDYVLETTGQDNLTYIGHSQGTTAFFVMCSEVLDCDKKINFMVALSAVAWMKHVIKRRGCSEVPLLTFNHLDFLWAKDVKSLLYDRVLEFIERYTNNCCA